MRGYLAPLRRRLLGYGLGTGGAAAAELALVLPILVVPLLNVFDLGTYAYTRMQVQNAALTGADQVRSSCNTANLPAVTKCGLTAATVTNFIQNTSLGTSVTLAASSPVIEAYYCTLTDGTLQMVGTSGTPGTAPNLGTGKTCSDFTAAAGKVWSAGTKLPGDYIRVTVTYTYTPLFAGLSVTTLLPTTLTQTGWSRLG
jgi:Flp pilus assembly protein TadG